MLENQKTRILLTDGHYKHTLGLARHLKLSGWDVWCIGNPYSEHRFSRFFTYVPFVLSDVQKSIDFIQSLVKDNCLRILLPIGAQSVDFFSANSTHFSDSTEILLPDRHTVLSAFDKLAMAKSSQQLKIKSPQTISSCDWLEKRSTVKKPFIIKSQSEFKNGFSTKYFSSRTEGALFLNSVPKKILSNLIVQERINGVGEAFFAIYNKGQLLTGYTHRRIREIPLSGGSSTCAESTESFDTFTSGKKILDSLKWHGAAMVEFKRETDSNELFLMEVNPKFWGSLELGISHGVNFSAAIHSIINNEFQIPFEKRTTVRYQWPFHGDLKNLRVLSLWRPVLVDLLNFKVKKNLYISDPLPLLIRPLMIIARQLIYLKFFRFIRNFYIRIIRQGTKIALLRSIEESFGLPTSKAINQHGSFIVGPQISLIGKMFLILRRVESSVNLQSEFDDKINNLDFENHLHLPCEEYEPLSSEELSVGVKFLHDQVNKRRKTYIHCREGVSRAPYLLASYYVSLGYSIDHSFEIISKQRGFINPLEIHKESISNSTDRLQEN